MHIMVDMEFLSNKDDGRIFQLSAVAFELNGAVLEPHELLQYEDRWFDKYIAPYPASLDQSNAAFWESEETAGARKLLDTRKQVSVETAFVAFTGFCEQWLGQRGRVWANPPQSDLRILRGNYAGANMATPWHHKQEMDLRTLTWAAQKVPRSNFKMPDMTYSGLVPHFALHDAVRQAVLAQAAYRALTISAAQRVELRRSNNAQ